MNKLESYAGFVWRYYDEIETWVANTADAQLVVIWLDDERDLYQGYLSMDDGDLWSRRGNGEKKMMQMMAELYSLVSSK